MRAAGPVLLLVVLAGCQSVFSASLEVVSQEDASYKREISDLQISEETEAKAEYEDTIMVIDCFGEATREQAEQKFNPTTSSSSSEEMTRDTETMSTKEEKTEDEGAEARVEVQTQSLVSSDMAEEDSDDAEERFDTDVLKRAGEGNTAVQ